MWLRFSTCSTSAGPCFGERVISQYCAVNVWIQMLHLALGNILMVPLTLLNVTLELCCDFPHGLSAMHIYNLSNF